MELEHGHGHGVKLIQDGYKWRIVLAYDGTQYAGFPLCSFHFIYKVLTFLKNSHLGRTLSTYLYPGFVVSFSLLIVVKEASLLWRAKSSIGSSYGVLDVNIFISIL